MRKFLNIHLFDNGSYKIPSSPISIYQNESESTVLRFIYEPSISLFKDNTTFKKVLTIKNKVGTYSYELNSSEYLFKPQDLIEGNIILNLEIYKVEEFGDPKFVIKYYINDLPPIKKSLSAVETINWQGEYEDLFQQSMGITLQDFKDKVLQIEEDVNILVNEDTDNDNKIIEINNQLNTLNNEIQDRFFVVRKWS